MPNIPGSEKGRLAYVTRKINGKRKHTVYKYDSKKGGNVKKEIEVDAGWIVYMPMGHAIAMSETELIRLGFDKEPPVCDFGDMHDPQSPVGRLFRAQSDQAREEAFTDMEEQVIQLVERRSGPIVQNEGVKHDDLARVTA